MTAPRRDRRRDPEARPGDAYRSARSVLAEPSGDVAYLGVKEQLGEPLTPSERLALERARSGREGGAP